MSGVSFNPFATKAVSMTINMADFDSIDSDGDKKITEEELKAYIEANNLSDVITIASLDKDGDKKVSQVEFNDKYMNNQLRDTYNSVLADFEAELENIGLNSEEIAVYSQHINGLSEKYVKSYNGRIEGLLASFKPWLESQKVTLIDKAEFEHTMKKIDEALQIAQPSIYEKIKEKLCSQEGLEGLNQDTIFNYIKAQIRSNNAIYEFAKNNDVSNLAEEIKTFVSKSEKEILEAQMGAAQIVLDGSNNLDTVTGLGYLNNMIQEILKEALRNGIKLALSSGTIASENNINTLLSSLKTVSAAQAKLQEILNAISEKDLIDKAIDYVKGSATATRSDNGSIGEINETKEALSNIDTSQEFLIEPNETELNLDKINYTYTHKRDKFTIAYNNNTVTFWVTNYTDSVSEARDKAIKAFDIALSNAGVKEQLRNKTEAMFKENGVSDINTINKLFNETYDGAMKSTAYSIGDAHHSTILDGNGWITYNNKTFIDNFIVNFNEKLKELINAQVIESGEKLEDADVNVSCTTVNNKQEEKNVFNLSSLISQSNVVKSGWRYGEASATRQIAIDDAKNTISSFVDSVKESLLEAGYNSTMVESAAVTTLNYYDAIFASVDLKNPPKDGSFYTAVAKNIEYTDAYGKSRKDSVEYNYHRQYGGENDSNWTDSEHQPNSSTGILFDEKRNWMDKNQYRIQIDLSVVAKKFQEFMY